MARRGFAAARRIYGKGRTGDAVTPSVCFADSSLKEGAKGIVAAPDFRAPKKDLQRKDFLGRGGAGIGARPR